MAFAAAPSTQGKLEISINGQRIDALGLARLTRYGPDQLASFDHLAPPKTLPVTQLRSVVAILDIAARAVKDTRADEKLAIEVVTNTNVPLRATDTAPIAIVDAVERWREPLFDLAD